MNPARPLPDPLIDALPVGDFLDSVSERVDPLGFVPDQTLAAVSICRDELTQHLMVDVESRWGPSFCLGGLGGLPSLGSTGWGACLSHVPERSGRGKLLVFGLPHVGLGPDGESGVSLRRQQDSPTPTCGALSSILSSWHQPPADNDHGLADHEALLLRRLLDEEAPGDPADIMDLTRIAAAAVEREMNNQLNALAPWDQMDVALFIAIQIHVSGQPDHVLPITASQHGSDGLRHDLELPAARH